MPLFNSLPTIIGAAAVVPAVLFLWLVVSADKRPEPPGIVWTAFLLGAASVLLLHYVRAPFMSLVGLTDNRWLAPLLRAVFLASMPEETVKIFVLVVVTLRRRPFEDPMDMAVYGIAVGLGFAAYENLAYLVQHSEDWRTLSFVRNVLTVPFHGAMGAIAGGYLAAARFGGALGAHRHGHLVRARLMISIWLVPVVLHALFDLPLLALQLKLDDGGWGHAMLRATGLLIGFGSIALAGRLIWRIDKHHRPPIGSPRAPAAAWRAIWAVLMTGGAATFLGAVLVTSAVHRGMPANADWQLMPVAIGIALIITGVAAFWWGRRHLRRSAHI